MKDFFEGLEEVNNQTINNLNTPGVWALFGKRNDDNGVEDDKWYCLQVGQTTCIKNEIQKDTKLLNEELNDNGTKIPYVNQFGEKLFLYNVYPSSREYLYSGIIKKQFKDFHFAVICKEKDKEKRKSIEKEFAYKTKAIYWRNGGPFKKGTEFNFENRKSETIEIPSNGEISDKIIDLFIERYNAQ